MTPDPHHAWSALRDVFDDAVQLPPEDRPAFLDAACADLPELRAGVIRLLEADAQAARQPDFLGERFVAFARMAHARAKQVAPPDYGFPGPLSTSSHDLRSSTHT